MNTGTRSVLILVAVILVVVGFAAVRSRTAAPAPVATSSSPTASVSYVCNAGKTIEADYYDRGDSVKVALSDGREFTLPHATSADGARYANAEDTFVFWGKGNGALVLENNTEKSYIGCVAVKPDPGSLPNVYQSESEGLTIRYPRGYTVDPAYTYEALGPNREIAGVKFVVAPSVTAGTNLSGDTYLSVETIPAAKSCTANLFLEDTLPPARTVEEGGTTYSVASSGDAAAGNRYEETVYALPGTNPCVGVRYLVHYGAFGNYPEGSVREFDGAALLAQFDAIRRTLVLSR